MQPKLKNFVVPSRVNFLKQEVPAHRIAYTEWGKSSDNNIAVCIHGLTRNSRDFDVMAHYLSKNFRVICIDIVGRGKSEWFSSKEYYNYSTYIQDVLELIRSLNLRNINIIGTSMGGIIGYSLAAEHPSLVKSLVLNDIGPFIPRDGLIRIAKYTAERPLFDTFDLAKNYFKDRLKSFGIEGEDNWTNITKNSTYLVNDKYDIAYDPGIATGMNIAPENIADVDLWHIWNKVNCPMMIIRGEYSDILTEKTSDEMLKSKKNIHMLTIRGVGHAPALMNVEQVSKISDWLSK